MSGMLPIARRLALVASLALATAGCESLGFLEDLELFGSSKKPIQGDRRAVFPSGIPGIEYNAPPQQPTNSNVPISTALAAPPPAETEPAGPAARPAQRAAARKKSSDPWAETR
jgi:hypothetical protein